MITTLLWKQLTGDTCNEPEIKHTRHFALKMQSALCVYIQCICQVLIYFAIVPVFVYSFTYISGWKFYISCPNWIFYHLFLIQCSEPYLKKRKEFVRIRFEAAYNDWMAGFLRSSGKIDTNHNRMKEREKTWKLRECCLSFYPYPSY